MASDPSPRTDAAGGLAFVLLWSTGYVAAAFALRGSGPYTLAVARFLGSGILIGLWLLVRRPPRSKASSLGHAAIAGVLLQGGFFGFIYAALAAGVAPATAGLITGLMPLTTAVGARLFLGEPLHSRAGLGLALGLAGVALVVAPGLRGPASVLGDVLAACALLSLSAGTLYQKRNAHGLDPRLALVVQLGASFLVLLPFALHEGLRLEPVPPVLLGLAWGILVNSCAGLLLYLWLLGRGAAGKVANNFYLVPPVTAVMTAVFLGAPLGPNDVAGLALTAAGVWIGQRA